MAPKEKAALRKDEGGSEGHLGGQYSASCADCGIRIRPARSWHIRCRQCHLWHRHSVSIRAAARALREAI